MAFHQHNENCCVAMLLFQTVTPCGIKNKNIKTPTKKPKGNNQAPFSKPSPTEAWYGSGLVFKIWFQKPRQKPTSRRLLLHTLYRQITSMYLFVDI